MRASALALLAASILTACAGEATAPAADVSATAAAEAATTIAAATAGSATVIKTIGTLPDSLRLSTEQRAKLSSLLEAFGKATKGDRDAIAAARAAAEAAKKAGKPESEIRAILAGAEAAAQRIAAADAALVTAIRAVLTPAQDAWVTSHLPVRRPETPKTPTPVVPRAPLPVTAGLLHKLPENLGLSTEQRAKVEAAIAAYATGVQADLQAIAAVEKRAADAKAAGKTRDEVQKILDEAAPARARIAAAQQALTTQLLALLTAEQKAWVAANTPKVCDPATFPPLTDAQRVQIAELQKAFETANRADLDAIAAARKKAEEAKRAGKSEAEVKAILDAVQPAVDRVNAARVALEQKIQAVLTPEQRASGCPWNIVTKR